MARAAGDWTREIPDEPGRYLCLYKSPAGDIRPFVVDYVIGDDGTLRWAKQGMDIEILCWADIYVHPDEIPADERR